MRAGRPAAGSLPWPKIRAAAATGASLADIILALDLPVARVRFEKAALEVEVAREHARHRLALHGALTTGALKGLRRASALTLLAVARNRLGWDRDLENLVAAQVEGARERLREAIEKLRTKKASEEPAA